MSGVRRTSGLRGRWYPDATDERRAMRESERGAVARSYVCECTPPDPRPLVVFGCTFMESFECGRCGHGIP